MNSEPVSYSCFWAAGSTAGRETRGPQRSTSSPATIHPKWRGSEGLAGKSAAWSTRSTYPEHPSFGWRSPLPWTPDRKTSRSAYSITMAVRQECCGMTVNRTARIDSACRRSCVPCAARLYWRTLCLVNMNPSLTATALPKHSRKQIANTHKRN